MNGKILKIIFSSLLACALICFLLGPITTYNTVRWVVTKSEINHGVADFSIFGTIRSNYSNFFFEQIEDSMPWKLGCKFDDKIYKNSDHFSIETQDARNFKTYESVLPIKSSDSWGSVGVVYFEMNLKDDGNWIIIRNGKNIIFKIFVTKKVEKNRFFSRLEKIMSV